MRLPNRLRTFLARPDALRWTVLLAIVLCLPSLAVGWILDDHVHHSMVNASDTFPALVRSPHALFEFILDDPDRIAWMHERGTLPWYASPDLRASFWRPISSWTIYWDHAGTWSHPLLAHLHSLLWYAASVFIVGLVFRRILGPGWVAAVATLVFAVDESHAMPVAWVANRSALLVMVFGVGSLLAHIRWRRKRDPLAGLAAPVLLLLALLSGELALCLTGYLLSFALFIDQGTPTGRLLSLLPSASVCAMWRVLYVVQGFGTQGSGLYIDPGKEPLRFASAALERIPLLLQAQLTPIPSHLVTFLDRPDALVFALAAALLVVVLLLVLWRALRHDPRAWFFATGMLLCALPIASSLPHDRLLLPMGIGGAGLVALLLASVHVRADSGRAPLPARALAGFFLLAHLIIAPLLLPINGFAAKWMGAVFSCAPKSLEDIDLENRTLVFVTGPNYFMTSWVPVYLHHEGKPIPSRVRTLGSGTNATTVRRIDPYTLELESPDGFLNLILDKIVWNPNVPFRVGQTVELSDMTLVIKRVTTDGRPDTIVCRFERPLEELDYVWVYWTKRGYRVFELPAVGAPSVVPAVSLPDIAVFATKP